MNIPLKKGGKTALVTAIAAGIEAAINAYLGEGKLPDGVITVALTACTAAILNAWKHRNDPE